LRNWAARRWADADTKPDLDRSIFAVMHCVFRWWNVLVRKAGRKKMGRKFIDCREFPSEVNCTLALSADNEDELLEAAVQHAITVHWHEDTPDFRTMIRTAMRDGTPPVEAPQRAA
jgi:predicted small metal-binding protein